MFFLIFFFFFFVVVVVVVAAVTAVTNRHGGVFDQIVIYPCAYGSLSIVNSQVQKFLYDLQ